MTKYQLIYNDSLAPFLCDTRKEAESFKQKAADEWPEMKVVIKEINQSTNTKINQPHPFGA
tara:strand:+ start:298 stop:480 length:183 start_codon:yes stop_codon:yes gene_type:complete